MKALLFFSLFTLMAGSAHAQLFHITRVTDTGSAALNSIIDTQIQSVENDINKDLPASSPKRLMEGMANSQALAGKGLSTDYITHFSTFTVGAGLGLAADLEKDKKMDSDISGIGVQGSVQVGLNMATLMNGKWMGLDPRRMTMMLNFFKYNAHRTADDNDITAGMSSFGVSGTYKWIDGNGTRLFGWDGVRLHTGYQYSALDLKVKSTINQDVDETASTNEHITGTVTGTPSVKVDSSTHSIPLEISSGVNFLYILSFYAGLGTDLNMGSAKGKGDLHAKNSNLNCTGGACGGGQVVTVSTTADINETGKVNPLFLRGFAGFQVNLPYTRIYVHANNVFGTKLYSAAAGLRFAF